MGEGEEDAAVLAMWMTWLKKDTKKGGDGSILQQQQ